MGKNIFVSYKYADTLVASLDKADLQYINGHLQFVSRRTRVRDYVDELQAILKDDDHINLGEKDGESLADFSDGAIETSLKKKIFRSSVTVVMISKGMKEATSEKDQWIPWEISYSLRVVTRDDCSSRMNAVLGIVLPDENNSYDWYYTPNLLCNCTSHHTNKLFTIMSSNMFNMKEPVKSECAGLSIHHGEFSFIKTVKWSEFKADSEGNLNASIAIRENKDAYTVKINL